MHPDTEVIAGQPSFRLANDCLEAWVTELGGHLGPVTYRLGDRVIQPYHVAPWAEEDHPDIPNILQVLRGDFFCMPFGGNESAFGGEQHPIHGETANARWTLRERSEARLHLDLETTIRPGRVEKSIRIDGAAIHSRHALFGRGPMNFGHHAMLRFRSPGRVSVSPFAYGQVYTGAFENPVLGGYSCLLPGGRFEILAEVPTLARNTADLTRYPAREGFEDLVMVLSDPSLALGWSAVVFPEEGYLWLSLKNPRQLTGTVLWHSNGGRHYAPWSGRHRGVLGIEEVTGYFHEGIAASCSPNPLREAGFVTCVELDPEIPTIVDTIMLVALVPSGFGLVSQVTTVAGGVEVRDESGQVIAIEVDLSDLLRASVG